MMHVHPHDALADPLPFVMQDASPHHRKPTDETELCGQWRDLLDDADLARYAARVRALASGNLVEWVHREPID